MRNAIIESFRREKGNGVIIFVDLDEASTLSDYEFDHLGDVVGAYLSALEFDAIIGPKSVRAEKTDEELEREFDDFAVVRHA